MIQEIGTRINNKNRIKRQYFTLGLFTAFLVLGIVVFVLEQEGWRLAMLIVGAVLELLSVAAFIFVSKMFSYSDKVKDKPLISYDEEKQSFTIYDIAFHNEVVVSKENVVGVKSTPDGGLFFWYKLITDEGEKMKSTFIGYSEVDEIQPITEKVQAILTEGKENEE